MRWSKPSIAIDEGQEQSVSQSVSPSGSPALAQQQTLSISISEKKEMQKRELPWLTRSQGLQPLLSDICSLCSSSSSSPSQTDSRLIVRLQMPTHAGERKIGPSSRWWCAGTPPVGWCVAPRGAPHWPLTGGEPMAMRPGHQLRLSRPAAATLECPSRL